MGRHIAFFNIPAAGHMYPTLAVVAELVRRGHRVTYASVPQRARLIEAMGATVVPYRTTRPADSDPDPRVPQGPAYVGQSLLNFLHEAEVTLPQLEPVFLKDRPDLVVHDRMAFVARIVAAKLAVPTVETWAVLVSNERWSLADDAAAFDPTHPAFPAYLARLDTLLKAQGLPIKPEEFLAPVAHRHLAFFPRFFQYEGDAFDERYCFVGPCVRPARLEEAWQPPPGGRPLALVSLGTINNRAPDFYRTCFAAFAGSPWRAVVAVGERLDPASLGPPPDNVEVRTAVPQLAVLEHARVFVSHAGMGGVMEALRVGVPQVVVPFTPEQEKNAVRVAQLGIGVRLTAAGLTPQALREAVDRVTTDDRMAGRISELRQQMGEAGGTVRAADVIEECLPG
ncbi:MAG TPA: macrolide family glycosyltransferase [Micromonosporaceae bacterium]|nr:macrolide family glycosyltransferase [Micromonosporaceae bacterium]